MAVPKRRRSRANTRKRRAQWKAAAPALVTVTVGGRSFRFPDVWWRGFRLGVIDPSRL
ncbi:50S ribosomal protein L32 [Rhodococcus hoagii]|nr:50S ribosomal protein L32 [Prescottella equi]